MLSERARVKPARVLARKDSTSHCLYFFVHVRFIYYRRAVSKGCVFFIEFHLTSTTSTMLSVPETSSSYFNRMFGVLDFSTDVTSSSENSLLAHSYILTVSPFVLPVFVSHIQIQMIHWVIHSFCRRETNANYKRSV